MSVLPNSRRDRITWFQNRLALWADHSDSIGLEEGQVATLTSMVNAAATSLDQAEIARDTSRSRTLDFHEATDSMSEFGAGLIKAIKAYAATTDDSSVYSLANIPAPAPPTPAPPPEAPETIFTDVNNDGSITVRWRYTNNAKTPVGFQVFRKLAGESKYALLGSTPLKTITDTNFPPGIPSVSYMIRAVRGTHVSDGSEPVVVYFGFNEGEGEELQIAA